MKPYAWSNIKPKEAVNKKSTKKTNNRQRHEFLLTFFEPEARYGEINVNGFWLVKYWNGHTEQWEVSIFTSESFSKYKEYDEKYRH